MVVVSMLTLSLMIGNHWFAPGLVRGAWSRRGGGDLRGNVLALRRVGIAVIMLLAWAYSRLVAGSEALADVGAVSFSALATLVPALGFAVWRPQTPPRAATLGVLAGSRYGAGWCWCRWRWNSPVPHPGGRCWVRSAGPGCRPTACSDSLAGAGLDAQWAPACSSARR